MARGLLQVLGMVLARANGQADVSWVSDSLALGGRIESEAVVHLAERLGISRVVDLRVEDRDDEALFRTHGIEVLHLPTRDNCAVSQTMLWHGVRRINQQLQAGRRVYVHCQVGVGRSALLVLCVLVSGGESPTEAMRRLKTARSKVSPNVEQLEALLQWSNDWRAQSGGAAFDDTVEDLAAIAY